MWLAGITMDEIREMKKRSEKTPVPQTKAMKDFLVITMQRQDEKGKLRVLVRDEAVAEGKVKGRRPPSSVAGVSVRRWSGAALCSRRTTLEIHLQTLSRACRACSIFGGWL